MSARCRDWMMLLALLMLDLAAAAAVTPDPDPGPTVRVVYRQNSQGSRCGTCFVWYQDGRVIFQDRRSDLVQEVRLIDEEQVDLAKRLGIDAALSLPSSLQASSATDNPDHYLLVQKPGGAITS